MAAAFEHSIFDEPDGVDAKATPKRFKVAPTFVIDGVVSLLFVIAVAPAWALTIHRSLWLAAPTFVWLLPIMACYVGKVLIINHLGRRGGDARTYVKSAAIVTDGPYGWSRHPTYSLAMLQFLLWSVMAVYLQAVNPWSVSLIGAAFGLPLAFFLINDLVVMPTEENMLRRLHPEEFDAYAARTRRWFGHYRQA